MGLATMGLGQIECCARLCARTAADLRARVAKLADAPDLGFRNRRFQNVALRFKKQSIYERKTRFFMIGVAFTTDE
jgi:hypothetical protein